MAPDWAAIEEKFHELQALPEGERGSRLAELDDETSEILRSLLSMSEVETDYLETPAIEFNPHDTVPTETHRSFGRYEVLDQLGKGGAGVVYRAWDRDLGRLVALKVLHLSISGKVLEREASILAQLSHSNIATVYDVGKDGENVYLAMELIEGSPLSHSIGKMTTREGLLVAHQIARALEFAHRREIVHRDIKPSNIRIDLEGNVKLLDFGIAANSKGDPFRSSGTFGYMSPEQLAGESVTPASDIYSFGVLLYECWTGAPAFPGEGMLQRIRANEEAKCDLERLSDLPEALRDLIVRCLKRNPKERPDAKEALDKIRAELLDDSNDPPSRRGHLPSYTDTFFGREREIEELKSAFENRRIISLVGPPGCGKSRLAVEFARQWNRAGEVYTIELSAGSTASSVTENLLRLLGISEASENAFEEIAEALGSKPHLLLLDNAETQLDECRALAEALFQQAPHLSILVTSRVPLGLGGEQVLRLDPFDLPELSETTDHNALVTAPAIALLLERIRDRDPRFEVQADDLPLLHELVLRLDGLPLALELISRSFLIYSVAELVERVRNSEIQLSDPSEHRPEHHRSLSNLIAHSYDALRPEVQQVLRSLTVYGNHFTLHAARVGLETEEGLGVVPSSILELVEHSLLQRRHDEGGELRFSMLESVREYVGQQLDKNEERERATSDFLRWCLHHLEQGEVVRLKGEHRRWRDCMVQEHQQLLHAITIPEVSESTTRQQCEVLTLFYNFWTFEGGLREGRRVCTALATRPSVGTFGSLSAQIFRIVGGFSIQLWDAETARPWLERSIELCEPGTDDDLQQYARNLLGLGQMRSGALEEAKATFQSVFDDCEKVNSKRATVSLNNLAYIETLQENHPRALEILRESHRRQKDRSPMIQASMMMRVGQAELICRELESSRDHLTRATEIFESMSEPVFVNHTRYSLANLEIYEGNFDAAREHLERGRETAQLTQEPRSIVINHVNLGRVYLRLGEVERARAELTAAEAGIDRCKAPGIRLHVELAIAEWERLHGSPDVALRMLEPEPPTVTFNRPVESRNRHLQLGKLYLTKEDLVAARHELRKLLPVPDTCERDLQLRNLAAAIAELCFVLDRPALAAIAHRLETALHRSGGISFEIGVETERASRVARGTSRLGHARWEMIATPPTETPSLDRIERFFTAILEHDRWFKAAGD